MKFGKTLDFPARSGLNRSKKGIEKGRDPTRQTLA